MENAKLSDFNMIKGKNKDIYKIFFANNEFVKECLDNNQIYKTWWTGRGGPVYSNSSCSFIDGRNKKEEQLKTETKERLVELFKPKSIKRFCRCFDEAVGGRGQEWMEIATLSSSSLAALLCFYSLSKEEHVLKMNIDGQEIEFFESLFEQKNSIGKEGHNSNMDVVLIGSNKQGESVILFLESKFSEYLSHGKYDKISDVYDEVYYQLTANQQPIDGLKIVRGKDMWSISAAPHRPQQYCQGIKQMISHYQGVQKGFIDSAEDKYDRIYLGEILFKFPEEVDAKHNSYNSYVGLYKQLAQKLNSINTCKKFKVIETSLSYQDVLKDFDLDPDVREFYAL